MYKVFINDKPLILSASPDFNFPDGISGVKVQISDHKSIERAFNELVERNFNFSSALFYNNQSAEKLLDDFISIFPILEAAGGVVMNNKKERLFIFRFGKWDLPKGKIEKGEGIEKAAIREVQEETGISHPAIVNGLPSTFHMYMYKGKWVLKQSHWFAMQYNGNELLVPQQEEGITKAEWMESNKMDEVFANTYLSLHDLLHTDLQQRG